jgi:hypothetical protein
MGEVTPTRLSLRLTDAPDLPPSVLKQLYRITGRSRPELRRAIAAGEPFYEIELFGTDHVEVAPRLERALDYLTGLGVPGVIAERTDSEAVPISLATISPATMRAILEGGTPLGDGS